MRYAGSDAGSNRDSVAIAAEGKSFSIDDDFDGHDFTPGCDIDGFALVQGGTPHLSDRDNESICVFRTDPCEADDDDEEKGYGNAKSRNFRVSGSMGAGRSKCRSSSIRDISRQAAGSDGLRAFFDCHAMSALSFVKIERLLYRREGAPFSGTILFAGNSRSTWRL
jgi:hypothetical protein